jgi:O-antigen/teichoic acid export membrane protein
MPLRDVLRNATVLYATKIVGYAINLWFVVLAANYLGPDGFGSLSFALSYAAIFKILTDLGLRHYIAREVSREYDDASYYFINSVVLKTGLAALTGVAVVGTALVIEPDPQVRKLIYLVAGSVILGSFTDLLYALFQAIERMEFQAIGEIIKRATLLIGAIVGTAQGYPLVIFGYVYVVSSILPFLFCSYVAGRHLFDFSFDLNLGSWRSLLVKALPFGLSVFFITTRFNVDIFLLSVLRNSASAGWFNAVYKLIWATVFVPQILTQVVYPVLSRLYDESEVEMDGIYTTVFKYLLSLAVPMVAGVLLLADEIIFLVYNPSYAPSVTILRLLIWSAALMFATQVFETLLNSMNSQRLVMKITGLGAVLNVCLDLALISLYGYIGASVATVLSDAVIFLLYAYTLVSLDRTTSPLTLLRRYAPVVAVPTAVMVGVVLIAERALASIFLIVPLAVTVYGLVFYFAGGITQAEIREVRNAIANE